MEKRRWLVLGILGLVLAFGLSGCIVSTSPGTEDVIVMNPGETKVFKVSGVNLNSSTTKCVWYINRMDGNYSRIEGTDTLQFTVSPEGEKSNRVVIYCEYYKNLFFPHTVCEGMYGCYLEWSWDWVRTDYKIWNICIPRNTTPVWQGDYYITDSTDVQMLTGYKVVTGSLIIDKSNNKNLSGLDNLISIGGNLEIGDYDGGNAALTSLTGLQNITSVGGYLNISTNAALTSLTGLENLASIGGYLNIEYNDNLISLTGLENITSVDGDLVIFYNKDLKSLSGLENIASVGGDLWIWNNQALTALGMADLQRVDLDLQISGNTKLCTSMAEQLRDQVQSRSGIGGQIYIGDNKTCTTP